MTQFADIVQQQLRKGDILARYGGEEFVVVLYFTVDEALRLSDKYLYQAKKNGRNRVEYPRDTDEHTA